MDDSFQLEQGDHDSYLSDEQIDMADFEMNSAPANYFEAIVQHAQNSKLEVPPVKVQQAKVVQVPLKESEMTEQNSICKICYKHAINAFYCNNEKCSVLMCGKCIEESRKKNENKCPFCREKYFEPQMSPYRDAINNMKMQCRLCQNLYVLEEEEKHYKTDCTYFHKIQCTYCKERLKKEQVVKHTREMHSDKLDQIIQEMYKCPPAIYDPKEVVNSRKDYLSCLHKSPKLGTTGKFYCGAKLDPPRCSCCNGFCGPTNGENCSDCMKLDILRLRLPKGYLVNSNGHICWKVGHSFICNTMKYYDGQICKEGDICRPCYNMSKNIQRYAHLL